MGFKSFYLSTTKFHTLNYFSKKSHIFHSLISKVDARGLGVMVQSVNAEPNNLPILLRHFHHEPEQPSLLTAATEIRLLTSTDCRRFLRDLDCRLQMLHYCHHPVNFDLNWI